MLCCGGIHLLGFGVWMKVVFTAAHFVPYRFVFIINAEAFCINLIAGYYLVDDVVFQYIQKSHKQELLSHRQLCFVVIDKGVSLFKLL